MFFDILNVFHMLQQHQLSCFFCHSTSYDDLIQLLCEVNQNSMPLKVGQVCRSELQITYVLNLNGGIDFHKVKIAHYQTGPSDARRPAGNW